MTLLKAPNCGTTHALLLMPPDIVDILMNDYYWSKLLLLYYSPIIIIDGMGRKTGSDEQTRLHSWTIIHTPIITDNNAIPVIHHWCVYLFFYWYRNY